VRIAFHVPRAEYLGEGTSGDYVLVRNMISGLEKRGHDIHIVSTLSARAFWQGRVPARRLVGEAIRVRRQTKRFAPDAWLVYGSAPRNPDLFGWWQRPTRYVLMQASASAPSDVAWPWRKLFNFAQRRALSRADKITVMGPKVVDELKRLGADPAKLSVLTVATEVWDEVPQQEARRRLDLPQDTPIVLCLSRLTGPRRDGRPYKTEYVLALVEAFGRAQLPKDTLLIVVGDGKGRATVEGKIGELGLESRVRLVGSVPHGDVRWYYSACDFFAYPILRDQPYIAFLEAQVCGRPVLTTLRRSSAELVQDGRTGHLARNPDEFAVHLAKLAGDRRLCSEMGRAARDYVLGSHSMDVRVRQYEDLVAS
jgi:phosphatidyl-myo-inositol dimannoside synthase